MVIGLGIDLTEIDRIAASLRRFGNQLPSRILRPEELATMPKGRAASWLAGRFAAKEAAVKALGTGFALGIGFQDIAIVQDELGKPNLHFYGAAAKRAEEMGVTRINISMTHGRDSAASVVVLEKD